jgi:predicted pyridoxine 5'-phosphate oxidase superfamily flavin-nucleotide-binding protein
MDANPFHAGELTAQERAGVSSRGAAIRDFMPDQHRQFFTLLPYLFAAAVDAEGWPVASVLTGPPGFVTSPDPKTLAVGALPLAGDPLDRLIVPGAAMGLLGLDLMTRRRNRANGIVAARDSADWRLAVTQSFGNCPQYIQTRLVEAADPMPGALEELAGLDAAAMATIQTADTCFVASWAGPAAGPQGGVDMSHRGGRPGFVHAEGDVLTIPDFSGNRYFNTLGNLAVEPKAALLFVDFAAGSLLHLNGTAEILWDIRGIAAPAGAERLWRFKVTRGWRRAGALPLRWRFDAYAPTTERTGVWASAA